MSDTLTLILGSFGGLAALLVAYVGWLTFKANKEAKQDAHNVDALGLGVASMKDALELNKQDIAALRTQLGQQATAHEDARLEWRVELQALRQRVELEWREELLVLRQRVEAAESREAACLERVRELTMKVQELTTRIEELTG